MEHITSKYKMSKIGLIPEDWEIKRFHEVFERIRRRNDINNKNILTISAQNGLVNQEEFFNKIVASKDLSNYFLLKIGEFAYNKSYSKNYPMGAIKRLLNGINGIVSPLYICFKAKENIVAEYYEQYFESGILNKEIYGIAQEGARNHGLLNISINEFFDIHLSYPSLEEQKAIAQILTTWDTAINKQEELINLKKEQKKGLMEILLTNKSKVLNGKWEIRKLKELFEERNETGFDELELLSVTQTRGVVKRKEIDGKDTSSEDKSKYKKVETGDIVYNSMRMWQGASGVSKDEGIVSPAYTVLKPKNEVDSNFYAYYFKLPRVVFDFYRNSQGLTSDTWNLKYPLFSKIKVYVPIDIKEQKAITQILNTADKEIELLEKELEYLKEQKKGLMQNLLTGKIRVKI